MENTTWNVPKELIDRWTKSDALREMRDMYAILPFGYKKALKCSVESEEIKRCFWRDIKKLYPELKKHSPVNYDHEEGTINKVQK